MSRRSRVARSAREVVVGGSQVAATLVASPVLRSHYNRWGAVARELAASMPGDDLVTAPRMGYTRAITIAASPEQVWPWLAQMGQGRGGLYSFDALENLARCDIHSASQVLEQYQDLQRGDLIRMGPVGYPCFRVDRVAAPRELVLIGADPEPPHNAAQAGSATGVATWQWQLQPLSGGTGTRLLVRQRMTYPDRMNLIWRVVEPIGFVMERQMLLGLKRRAEASRAT